MNNYTIIEENKLLKSENTILKKRIKDKNNYIKSLLRRITILKCDLISIKPTNEKQMTIYDYLT